MKKLVLSVSLPDDVVERFRRKLELDYNGHQSEFLKDEVLGYLGYKERYHIDRRRVVIGESIPP